MPMLNCDFFALSHMKMVTELEQLTRVRIIEDDAWYYVESVETGDQVDIAFDDPKVARRYALSQRLVLVEVG